MNLHRRGFITGLGALIAAPAIVRVASIMPVRSMPVELEVYGASPAMTALKDLEFLEGQQFVFRTSIPLNAWRQYNQAAVVTDSVWRGMPGGVQ